MSWARIDDKLFLHPKIVRAGNEAMGAWVRMLAWTSCHEQDGRVPNAVANAFCESRDVLERLVDNGLLDKADDHEGCDYIIHDYLEWNPSKEELAEKKEKSRERKESWKNKNTTGTHSGTRSRTHSERKRLGMGMGSVLQGVEGGTEPLLLESGIPDLGKPANATQRKLVDDHARDAIRVLEELNAARKRVDPATRGIKPSYASLAKISERLEEGATVEDCLHVVAVGEQESTGSTPQALTSRGFFDAISPFRQENFQRKLQRTATKPSNSKPMTPGEQLQAEIEAREAEEYRRRGVG